MKGVIKIFATFFKSLLIGIGTTLGAVLTSKGVKAIDDAVLKEEKKLN